MSLRLWFLESLMIYPSYSVTIQMLFWKRYVFLNSQNIAETLDTFDDSRDDDEKHEKAMLDQEISFLNLQNLEIFDNMSDTESPPPKRQAQMSGESEALSSKGRFPVPVSSPWRQLVVSYQKTLAQTRSGH